jgi:hypothetical protein
MQLVVRLLQRTVVPVALTHAGKLPVLGRVQRLPRNAACSVGAQAGPEVGIRWCHKGPLVCDPMAWHGSQVRTHARTHDRRMRTLQANVRCVQCACMGSTAPCRATTADQGIWAAESCGKKFSGKLSKCSLRILGYSSPSSVSYRVERQTCWTDASRALRKQGGQRTHLLPSPVRQADIPIVTQGKVSTPHCPLKIK